MLQEIIIPDFKNSAGSVQEIGLAYQIFGPPPGIAPVVLVNHALTGNSQVTGEKGWWKSIIGPGKVIDTNIFTVVAFNIPGNGYDGKKEHLIHDYKEFTLQDMARIFSFGLKELGIKKLFAGIGGSIGGALLWELAVLQPQLIQNIIPIATDFKATDWVLAHCKVQDQILNNSNTPVHDARLHAMTFYRTPQSFTQKFSRTRNEENSEFNIHSWLTYHGKKLEQRFQLASYKLMNHLLTTIDISGGSGNYVEAAGKIQGNLHIITVDSDWFFLAEENREAYKALSEVKKNVSLHEIKSLHGHDAFLIENEQIIRFLQPIFHEAMRGNNKTEANSLSKK